MLNDVKAELLRQTTFTLAHGPQVLLRKYSEDYNTKYLEVHWGAPIPVFPTERPVFHAVCPKCFDVHGKRTPFRSTHL